MSLSVEEILNELDRLPPSQERFFLNVFNLPDAFTEEQILKVFDGIEIARILHSNKGYKIVDLEFDSKEEFIKAACLQNEKIDEIEISVRFSILTRREKPADG